MDFKIRTEGPKELYLGRHAEAIKNTEKRHGGGNQELTEYGESQAMKMGRAIGARTKLSFEEQEYLVMHQEEMRSKYTAELVNGILEGVIIGISGFSGIDLGARAGLSEEELKENYPEVAVALEEWVRGESTIAIPDVEGGERTEDYFCRIGRCVLDMVQQAEKEKKTPVIVGTTSALVMANHVLENDGVYRPDRYMYHKQPLGSAAEWETSQDAPRKINDNIVGEN